jgi:hypothetical protein
MTPEELCNLLREHLTIETVVNADGGRVRVEVEVLFMGEHICSSSDSDRISDNDR